MQSVALNFGFFFCTDAKCFLTNLAYGPAFLDFPVFSDFLFLAPPVMASILIVGAGAGAGTGAGAGAVAPPAPESESLESPNGCKLPIHKPPPLLLGPFLAPFLASFLATFF